MPNLKIRLPLLNIFLALVIFSASVISSLYIFLFFRSLSIKDFKKTLELADFVGFESKVYVLENESKILTSLHFVPVIDDKNRDNFSRLTNILNILKLLLSSKTEEALREIYKETRNEPVLRKSVEKHALNYQDIPKLLARVNEIKPPEDHTTQQITVEKLHSINNLTTRYTLLKDEFIKLMQDKQHEIDMGTYSESNDIFNSDRLFYLNGDLKYLPNVGEEQKIRSTLEKFKDDTVMLNKLEKIKMLSFLIKLDIDQINNFYMANNSSTSKTNQLIKINTDNISFQEIKNSSLKTFFKILKETISAI